MILLNVFKLSLTPIFLKDINGFSIKRKNDAQGMINADIITR